MTKKIVFFFLIMLFCDLLSFVSCKKNIVYRDMDCSINSVEINVIDINDNWSKFILHIILKTDNKWSVFNTDLPVNWGFKAYATGVSINKIYTVPSIVSIEVLLKNSKTDISNNLQTSSGRTIKEYVNTLNGGTKINTNRDCSKYSSKSYYNKYCYEQNFVFIKKT